MVQTHDSVFDEYYQVPGMIQRATFKRDKAAAIEKRQTKNKWGGQDEPLFCFGNPDLTKL